MDNFGINRITPFVPSNDYSLSLKFYRELGFDIIAELEKMTLFETGNGQFWLQDYYVEEWADNCMLCLYVKSLESWYARIQNINPAEKYGGKSSFNQPHEQHDAPMMQLIDPAGVLWHIRESD